MAKSSKASQRPLQQVQANIDKDRQEALEHLQSCEEELEHATSMQNVARIKQCASWVAEARAQYEEINAGYIELSERLRGQ